MADLNFNNVFVSDAGRVSFSGLTSGIDFRSAVDAIVKAKSIPVDTLQTRITENDEKIAALKTLRTDLTAVRESLSTLYGALSIDDSKDVFQSKQVFATSTRTDSTTPTTAANLVGVAVTNQAELGRHTVEVLQAARAHKISSNAQGSQSNALGLAGTITINGQSITVAATDSLLDLRDRINATSDDSDVTASVVSASSGEHYLVLTATETGQTMTVADSAGTVLQSLGVIDGGGNIVNELQAAKLAEIRADGLTDNRVTQFVSDAVADPDAALGLGTAGTLRFAFGAGFATTVDIPYLTTDSLQDVADAINGDATLAANGISASIALGLDGYHLTIGGTTDFNLTEVGGGSIRTDLNLQDDLHISEVFTSKTTALGITETYTFTDTSAATLFTLNVTSGMTLEDIQAAIDADADLTATIEEYGGGYRLRVTDVNTGDIAVVTPSGSDALGFNSKTRIVERTSNTINDLFQGVTLTLFDEEVGTTVNIDVDRNLSAVKTAVEGFVTAYNDLKVYLNEQTFVDPITGARGENATLLGSTTVANIESTLQRILGTNVSGVSSAFSVLAQVGVTFVPDAEVDDPLNKDTLTIDESKLDEALLNNPEDVRKLFAFNFTSSDPRIVLLGFNGQPAFRSAGYTLDVVWGGASLTSATVTGDTADSVSVSGRIITVDAGDATGLTLYFSGDASVSGIQLDFTLGVGMELFFAVDDVLNTTSGAVENEIKSLEGQNDLHEDRIEQMLDRIDLLRENLLARFIAMEQAIERNNNIVDQIQQTFAPKTS